MNLDPRPLQICPVAPTNVSGFTDQISGNVLWVVIWMFGIALLVSVGAILAGKAIHAPHITKGGVTGLAGTVATAVVLMAIFGIVNGILGSGCVG